MQEYNSCLEFQPPLNSCFFYLKENVMNDLKGIIEDLNNSVLVDNDFFLKLGLSDEEVDNSYSGCTTEGEIIIMLQSQQQELTQLKTEKSGEWVDVGESEFYDTDRRYKCSVCGKEVNGYDIGYYFKFCHGCGAKMKRSD